MPEIQKWQDDEIELSRRMIIAWSSFAKTGNPGWARYEEKDKVIKHFDSQDSLRYKIISRIKIKQSQ